MARRPWTYFANRLADWQAGDSRLLREASRLAVALALLVLAAVSSSVTGVPLDGTAQPATSRPATRSRFLRHQFSRADRDSGPAAVAELQRQDQAFRLIAGLEPVETAEAALVTDGAATGDTGLLRSFDGADARTAYTMSVDLGSVIRRARRESFSWRAAEASIAEARERATFTPSIVPAAGYISSGFNRARRHPILNLRRPHRGLDIVAPYGSPIVASARGRVSFVGYAGEYGLTVEIDHGHGLRTRYAHTSRALVRVGEQVARGEVIARVGRSGLADGSHVHYEVLLNGEPQNPRRYIFDPKVIPD